jgi:molybdopterin-guanine dinucleotide biosynthesis protein A
LRSIISDDTEMGTAIVLAGGAGTRLGRPKAAAALAGRPLVEHVLAAVRDGGLEPIVVAKADSGLPPLDCLVVIEPAAPRHPLCGIIAGLEAIEDEGAVVCATDMPFVTGALLRWLGDFDEPLAVIAEQPFPARYGRAIVPALREALANDESLRALARRLATRHLDIYELAPFGDPRRLLANINTLAELAAADG